MDHPRRCPHCKEMAVASPVGFTWWGGMLGPSLLNHVQCKDCRGRYNGKSGKPNTTAIAIYLVVVSLIAFGALFALMRH
jgi:hypothetical protein